MRTFEINRGKFTDVIDIGDDNVSLVVIDHLIKERDELKEEVIIARKRLGPAGYNILEDYKALKVEIGIARDLFEKSEREVFGLRSQVVARTQERNGLAAQLLGMREVVAENHKWHKDYDYLAIYEGSDLFQINEQALSTPASEYEQRVKGLMEAVNLTIAKADDHGDSFISKPIRAALAAWKGER